jgi:hypothetical protein
VIEQISVDEMGRLWVRRSVPSGELPRYDVFRRSGEYLGSLRAPAGLTTELPLRVRGANVYGILREDMDVQYVARAPLPAALGVGTSS